MTLNLPPPLGGPPPNEIQLAKAPLERVIAQVRFTPIVKLGERSFIAGFQEALRAKYPFFEEESEQFVQVDFAAGAQSVSKRPLWRFLDSEKNWRISLTSESVALEVKRYTSRADFLERWSEVLATTAQFTPAVVVRIGMRYVDRLRDESVPIVSTLIKPEYLGPLLTKFQDQVRQMMSETILSVAEGNLLLRLGKLPGNATIDPNVLSAIKNESFIIDIDVSSDTQRNFVCQELEDLFRQFAERAYAMFRDMVTPEFDNAYGGQL